MNNLGSKPPDKLPPTAPSIDPALQRQRLAWLAWIRVGLGGLGGLLSGLLGFVTLSPESPNPNAVYGLYIAILFYIVSYYFARNVWVKGIAHKDRNKLITQGIGSYVMMFLFVWIIYNTYNYCAIVNACHL